MNYKVLVKKILVIGACIMGSKSICMDEEPKGLQWATRNPLVQEGMYHAWIPAARKLKELQDSRALHHACTIGYLDAVKLFIDLGAPIDVPYNHGMKPFQIAPGKYYDETPLKIAAGGCTHSINHQKIVAYLIEHGADVNTKNKKGSTMLHCAAQAGDIEAVKSLINYGALINAKNNSGETPLDWAIFSSGSKQVVEYLMRKGASSTIMNGRTSLHRAIGVGSNPEITEFLIKNGSSIDVRDNLGDIPVHEAAYRGKVNLLKLLVSQSFFPPKNTRSICADTSLKE